MNINYLKEGMEKSAISCGIRLSPEEELIVKNSLILLQNDNKFHNIFFWGRINAIENDYYIAYGYTKDCLAERKFFYSVNGFRWIMLPSPVKENISASILCPDMFIGDPTAMANVVMDPEFTIDDNQVILATPPQTIRLKEEDRLSSIVHIITEESALIPRGALYKLTDMNVIYNPEFRGLNELDSTELINYQLYRNPHNEYNYNLLKRSDYNLTTDFLDTIDDIVPENNAFAVNLSHDETFVSIKSLVWPGMFFFHKLHSKKHGFVYFGNGKKNFDLLFMLNKY
ncbi:radial spoke head protein 9 homolog [Condylostylus longicornis]|uniref:radial spoke head protein 9 homolog n=1 Tax=Condylostylus longicornis TaxID=2530218 RepID=UPI00244DB736|nr:radial spoke head protein 9 homolog [Condylostylus longicornis]